MRALWRVLDPRDKTAGGPLPLITVGVLLILAFILGAGVGGVGGYLVRDHQGFYQQRYTTGLLKPPGYIDEPRKLSVPHLAVPASAAIDFTYWHSGNNDQGPIGSCQAWSYAKQYSFQYNRSHPGKSTFFSPRYLYDYVAQGNDQGSWIEQYPPIFNTKGAPAFTQMAYGPTAPTDGLPPYALEWPVPDRFDTMAAAHHAVGASTLSLFQNPGAGDGGVSLIKASIASGDPVNIGIPVTDSFWPSAQTGHADLPSGDLAGYHAITIVRYDDSHTYNGVKGWFLASNQWGRSYGVGKDGVRSTSNGYVWLSYRFIAQEGFSASTVRTGNVALHRRTGATYWQLSTIYAGAKLFGLQYGRGVVNSAYWYESDLLGSAAVADIDYLLPYGAQEFVKLPGGRNDRYWYAGAVYIAGSGWVSKWITSAGGHIAFLHMSRLWTTVAGAPHITTPPLGASKDSNPEDKTNDGDQNVVKAIGGFDFHRTAGVGAYPGGSVVGVSGWPLWAIYGNGIYGPINAHLCLVLDYIAANHLYRLYYGTPTPDPPKPKPPTKHRTPFPATRWNHYRRSHHRPLVPYKKRGRLTWPASIFKWHVKGLHSFKRQGWNGKVMTYRYVGGVAYANPRNRHVWIHWRRGK